MSSDSKKAAALPGGWRWENSAMYAMFKKVLLPRTAEYADAGIRRGRA